MPDYIDPQLLAGVQQQPNFSLGTRFANAARPLLGNQDLALALLANSGASPQKRGFGEIFGTSMLQANQMKQGREDDAFKRQYMQAQMDAMGAKANRQDGRSPYGQYQPGDYTPKSWAAFLKSENPADLERYTTPRQEYTPSFKNVTRTLPDGSTEMGSFDTRTNSYTWSGMVVPAGTKERVGAQGTAKGKVAGDLEAKGPRAYEQFKLGIGSLENAMSNTMTGPLAGRLPAMTSAQQTAEGAEAVMAPILKQLFRESGEGTFTEGDQALLLKMVPNRTDHEEARKAKIEMIDGIVKAKLGIQDGAAPASPPPAAAPTLDQIRAKYGR